MPKLDEKTGVPKKPRKRRVKRPAAKKLGKKELPPKPEAGVEQISPEEAAELADLAGNKERQENGSLIETAYFLYLKKYGRYPSYGWIAEHTGLAERTVARWFARLSLLDIFKDTRVLTRAAIAAVAQKVILTGDANELEKYLRIVEDFEVKTTERTGDAVNINLSFEELRERRNQIQRKDEMIQENPAVLGLVTEEAVYTDIA